MSYKVGDSVVIRDWNDMKKEFGLDYEGCIPCNEYFVPKMKGLCNKTFIIERMEEDIKGYSIFWFRGIDTYSFSEHMFDNSKRKVELIMKDLD